MALTAEDIKNRLDEQLIDSEEGVLLLQPHEDLPCIYDLLEAYLPEQAMGLEILHTDIKANTTTTVVKGYAALFGLPPVKIEATFFIEGEEIHLKLDVKPEMGVTPSGLFPELTGSGLWIPLGALELGLHSNAYDPGKIEIKAGLNPGLDDLLAPLMPLLAEYAPVTGHGSIGATGTLESLRIETDALKSVSFGMVTLSDIRIALVAEENEKGLLQAALQLEGKLTLELDGKTVIVDFNLIPAPPDRPFHVLYAALDEEDGDSLDSAGLGLPLPDEIPAELKLQSIRVLLGAVSGVPEDITIAALLEGEMQLLPGITIYQIGGAFTLWPTADPVSGRADIYGKVSLGGAVLDFTLEIPEQAFSIELDPATAPNIKQSMEDLIGTSLPASFPDMDIVGFRIAGNAGKKNYNFYFALDGTWDFEGLIGLDLSLKSISLRGNVDASQAETRYYGVLAGTIQLGEEAAEGETPDGVLDLSVELTSGGAWILEGGLASGSVLSLPQLVSVVGIAENDVPADLRTLVITELNARLNTESGQAGFRAASDFSLKLPFGGSGLDLTGRIALEREKTGNPWIGEASGEMRYKTLRLKASFPINDPDMNLSVGLWLPEGGNPDNGDWLDCSLDKKGTESIQLITVQFNGMNIFNAIERFINLMIPGYYIDFPYPWSELEKIDMPDTELKIDLRTNAVTLSMSDCFGFINEVPGIDIKSIALTYDTDDSRITFNIDGKIFDSQIEPFDPVTEDPPALPVPDIGFELRYLGLGRHVAMRNAAGYDKVAQAIDDLRSAFDENPRKGGSALGPLTYNADSEWLIGFDFTAAGFLSIGAIFNDPLFYGLVIRLDGPAAKAFSGFEFEILYKRIAPGLGVYSMELELPPAFRVIELGAVTLKLPVIGVDIFTNGNFKLDFGFPYGGNFGRSFYLSVLPFTGAGGFYYGSLNGATSTTVPQIINGEFDPVIEFGIGFTVGVGKSIGSGCFYAEINIGIMTIVEGTFATYLPYDKNQGEDLFYRLSGTFGIFAYVRGRIDFSIICINFSVDVYLIASVTFECYMPININARAGVRVKARIKIGWFKITLSFSTEVRVSYTLGSRQPTPWIVGTRALPASMGRGFHFHNDPRHQPSLRMTMGNGAALHELTAFDWTQPPAAEQKEDLTWHSWYGVSIDLDANNGDKSFAGYAVASPLAGFAEEIDSDNPESSQTPPVQFETWLRGLFNWLLSAWHGELPQSIHIFSAERMDRVLQSEASVKGIGWSELNAFIKNNFVINLKSQPSATEESQYKLALVPLPPALNIKFEIEGVDKEDVDLSAGPVVAKESLADIKERAGRYAPLLSGLKGSGSGAPEENAPMSEWLWRDIISLQLKELAARLLALMEKCPLKMEGANSYTKLGDIYKNLVYDPHPNDADREPFFEEFIEANMTKTELLDIGVSITIPLSTGAVEYTIEEDDTLEKIAGEYGLAALELAAANLYVELVKPGSEWLIPFINELTPQEAWDKLRELNAYSDISAMTSRFLLHGVRLPVDGDWQNLYEASALQFKLPVSETTGESGAEYNIGKVKLTLTPANNGHRADWLLFNGQPVTEPPKATDAEDTTEGEAVEPPSVKLHFGDSEVDAIRSILEDPEFDPQATVTAMAMTREEMVDFSLARSIQLRQKNGDKIENSGRLRTLPITFFNHLKGLPPADYTTFEWLALPAKRSRTRTQAAAPASASDPERMAFSWAARLDMEVTRLDEETAVKGRSIYRITGIEPTSRLLLEQTLADLKVGSIGMAIAPALGVAGPSSNDGGLVMGSVDVQGITLFRNDADERPETPAFATNLAPLDFLQLLGESLHEESGTFFLADVLPELSDADERIFAGSKKGIVTVVLFPTGDVDLLHHVDAIYLAEGIDKGSEALRFTAPGLTRRRARYKADMLHFRIERPEPDVTKDGQLESLYSLFSYYLSDENGNDCSPPSLPVGPREETTGTWLYEQVIPAESALENRSEHPPYSLVGSTRYLNITWRDIFGNEAGSDDFTFTGFSVPPEPGREPAEDELNLTRLPLKCCYYDDIIGVNRWPGVQAAHRFVGTSGSPELEVNINFDPSLLGAREENSDEAAGIIEELARVIAQLQDERLIVEIGTTLEEQPDSEIREIWKSKLLRFVQDVELLMRQAEDLKPMELTPESDSTLRDFRDANRITAEELARPLKTLPLGQFLDRGNGATLPLIKIPIKWQVGRDSLNSIAGALDVTIDLLIESLSGAYGNEAGLLKEGLLKRDVKDEGVKVRADHTINAAAADLKLSPVEFLQEFADREELLTPKKVLKLVERSEVLQPDESLGMLRRRLIYEIETVEAGSAATSGLALAPEASEIVSANDNLILNGAAPIMLENRLTAPTEASDWHNSALVSPVAVAAEMGISLTDFLVLNARRSDVIQKDIVISIEAETRTGGAPLSFALTTVESDSFETLRRACSGRAGRTVTMEEFGAAIGGANLLRGDARYLKPPPPLKLTRPVVPRQNPAAFELKAMLVLRRFAQVPTEEDFELIHPELHDEEPVWFMSSDIAPALAGAVSDDKTTALQGYAKDFQNALAADTLHLGLGTPRRAGSEKPSLWAVRLGAGGYNYQVETQKPAFLSLRPLATTPMNRKKVPVYKFIEDKPNLTLGKMDAESGKFVENKAFTLRNYSDIDFDEWALTTLAQLDRLLRPATALALAEAGLTPESNSYDRLLEARAELASALTTGLTEIIDYADGEPAKSEVTRRIMKERIGNRLAAAYDIDTAVFFPLTFDESGGEPFMATGNFVEDKTVALDTGYTLQPTSFKREEDHLAMAVDVLKPEEHRTIDTGVAFQLSGLEIQNSAGEDILLSFVIPPSPTELGELSIPVPLRDLPTPPRLSHQQGVADYEMDEKGYPALDSYDDLLAWRYEVDFQAEFAEQDTHSMEIFFNLKALEELAPMLGVKGRLFQDLFHALAQCDTTLIKYIDLLEKRVAAKYEAGAGERADLHWIIDDMVVLIKELALHWREHYERGGPLQPVSLGEGLRTTKHRYDFTEERVTESNTAGAVVKDDLVYTFRCAPGDPPPMVRVDGIEGETEGPEIETGDEDREIAVFTVTLSDWFAKKGKNTDELEELPRRFGFTDLHILEKQNVRVRIKTVRNAELLEGQKTAEAFIYRTPVVTLPDRFFPSVELEKRIKIDALIPGGAPRFSHPTELLADVLHRLLGLGFGPEAAGIKRRLALSVRYGFGVAGDWSDTDSFGSETPLFFEPRFILDHVPDTSKGVNPGADDAVSRLGREMAEWLDNAGARRENAGFVIGIDVYTDETINPALAEKNAGDQGARDDARLLRIMRLEADFPGMGKWTRKNKYYINMNAQANGDHEVHLTDCRWLPNTENRAYLGEFASGSDAVAEGKKRYDAADGCAHCLPECHTS
ncbi:MAG: LysM peptidoglycan-binding domain-containing protein [Deltaproteobacteria bacterium]|nr:LysM peptidoglycan-binding domain-containing protein [Deltaproteobacteria bacterium]